MDECLGSFMSLWAFCELLPEQLRSEEKPAFLEGLAERIANSGRLWLFRPGLDSLWKALLQAQHHGSIVGCFILSNNGSAELVELVRRAINIRVRQFSTTPGRPLFITGWHRYARCRGGKVSKDFDQIQKCLASEGLPTMENTNDLLFFDDLEHMLQRQIPHYIRVRPYNHYTPIHLVHLELSPIFTKFNISPETVSKVMNQGVKTEANDMKNDADMIPYPPTKDDAAESRDVFVSELKNFLKSSPRSKTRKQTISNRRTTRRRGTVRKTPGYTAIRRTKIRPPTVANMNTLFRRY
jgi:hypothetical protein